MIPPRLQVITVLMFILTVLIVILATVDHFYWLLLLPWGYMVYSIYLQKPPK